LLTRRRTNSVHLAKMIDRQPESLGIILLAAGRGTIAGRRFVRMWLSNGCNIIDGMIDCSGTHVADLMPGVNFYFLT